MVPATPINESPDMNRFQVAYAESVVAREQPEELPKESEELKKLKKNK